MRSTVAWVAAWVAAWALTGCASSSKPPPAACASTTVILMETTPLFTGPGPTAALDRPLSKGQPLRLCSAQGQRQQVLLPRPGRPCSSPADCSAGWISTSARMAPAR